MITLEELAAEVQDLAPLPAAAAKLAMFAADENVEASLIIDTIRYDQALTARVLRYANSPMAGARFRIRSVKDAVVRLGLGTLLKIAVSAQVQDQMSTAVPEYGLGEDEIWKHSVAASLAAELLMRQHGDKIPPISFTAALLHDIGKLILARYLKAPVQKSIQKLVAEHSMTHHQAELEVLGFTHASVGGIIAARWNLGETISNAITRHHDIGDDKDAVIDVVQIGNLVAKTIGFGLGNEGLNLAADSGACKRLGITSRKFEGLCAEVAGLLSSVDDLCA
ncbi:MAG: HDOD domain-containing protein [Candidatus Eisenbacteria sp.]|nr:HDOD domain-containing protein [Candidatus Eisenbacteria bacterium]